MNDAERRQLVADLMALSDTLWSAIQTAQGERLKQLLELANESEMALRELQQSTSRPSESFASSQMTSHA